MSKLAAKIVAEQITNKPKMVLGFATGSTPQPSENPYPIKALSVLKPCFTRVLEFSKRYNY
jgi:hypothetical protein